MRLIPRNSPHAWTAFVWLIYLGFFIAGPAFKPRASAWDWAAMAAGLVSFLILYFRGFWVSGRQLLLCIGGITLLGVIFTPFNIGAGSFFIYAAAFAGNVAGTREAVRIIVALELITVGTLWLEHVPLIAAFWPALFVMIIGGVNAHYAQLNRANKKLALAHEEIERLAKVAERERIARDLHDLLGHTLSLIILKSELASKLAERDPARAAEEIADVERISRDALAEVRQAVRGYRGEGVDRELEAARQMLGAVDIELQTNVQPVPLTSQQETIVALAIREAVTNVVRHSSAQRCSIDVGPLDGGVRLTIKDDGRGGAAPEGNGLTGMRERITSLGGTLTRDGSHGTTLTIIIPASSAAGLERSA